MTIDWPSALRALDIRRFAVTLTFRATVSGPTSPVRFPFFHQPIIHGLMKEILRVAPVLPGIAPPWRVTTPSPSRRVSIGLIPAVVESGRVEFHPGDSYTIGFSLVGPYAPPADVIVAALHGLGARPAAEAPYGQLSGNFDVGSVQSLPSPTVDELDRQLAAVQDDGKASIRLVAPFHGRAPASRVRDYLSASHFDASGWVNAIHWRVFTLLWGRKPDQSIPDECPPPMSGMTIAASSLFNVRVPKRRSKEGRPAYDLLGVIGSFSLEGVPATWWPWLLLGQYLNAGEGTGWGFGRYRLETDATASVFRRSSTFRDRLADPHRLRLAAERLKYTPEIDGVTTPDVPGAEDEVVALAAAVRDGSYRAAPLNGFEVNVRGALRAIAVGSHRDRIVQRAVVDLLDPSLESLFNDCSVGYRRKRSRLDAARTISQAWTDGYRYALDADITAFFDRVDWKHLFTKLEAFFPDEPLNDLLRQWVTADVVYRGQRIVRTQGLPLGIAVSPMLANLYLDDLDDELESQGFRLVRFADDFVVLTKDLETAEAARKAARQVLIDLGLELSEQKTQIVGLDSGLSYLGYLFCRSLVIDEHLSATGSGAHAPIIKSTWLSHLPLERARALAKDGSLRLVVQPDSVERVPLAANGGANQTRWGLYVIGRGTALSARYGTIVIVREGQTPVHIPIETVSHVVIVGSGRVSSPTVLALGARGIPVFFCTRSGKFVGTFRPEGQQRQAEDYRIWLAQAKAAEDEAKRLVFAKAVVAAKLARQSSTVYRFGTPSQRGRADRIREIAGGVGGAETLDALRGFEGSGSRILFEGIGEQLKGVTESWPFTGRDRRPPPDPVNCLLSFGYTLLYIHSSTALWAAGLMPQVGLFHSVRPGHLALASDLVEEFRHEIDRLVVRLVNRREVREEHFLRTGTPDYPVCRLTDDGRRVFIGSFDRRLQEPGGAAADDTTILRRLSRQAERIRAYVMGETANYQPSEE